MVTKTVQDVHDKMTEIFNRLGRVNTWSDNEADWNRAIDYYDDLWGRAKKRPDSTDIHDDLVNRLHWPPGHAFRAASIWTVVCRIRRNHAH